MTDDMLRRPLVLQSGTCSSSRVASMRATTTAPEYDGANKFKGHRRSRLLVLPAPSLPLYRPLLLLAALSLALIVTIVYTFLLSSRGIFLRRGKNSDERCRILQISSPSKLSTLTELDLSGCNLSSIPQAIQHCTSVRNLDISFNPLLSTLPDELSKCTKLDILFSSNNPGMTTLPTVLGLMPSITRLGWRSGSLATLDTQSIPPNLVHLILTNNQLTNLDDEAVFDRLTKVRKLMLSHNKVHSISDDGISKMKNLELLRLAGNELTSIPDSLWTLPKLTWLTISGNPGLGLPKLERRVPTVSLSDLSLVGDEKASYLGAGASGSVTARKWQGKGVAVKIIRGVTSDGRAQDELEIYGAVGSDGMEHRVVGCVAVFQDEGDKTGVVMEKIPEGLEGEPLEDLAMPPSIVEVTVDRYENDDSRVYTIEFILNALSDAVTALSYLHETIGVAHGDFYAHNIKIDNHSGHLYLLDFGASYSTGIYAKQAEKLEVRALGVLMEELVAREDDENIAAGDEFRDQIIPLVKSCFDENFDSRPTFAGIADTLGKIRKASSKSIGIPS